MRRSNPWSRVLFFVAVFLFGLPAIDAHAQKTGELPKTPGLGTPAPGRVLITPDFKLPTQDKGGVERSAPIIREGIEEQRKGLEPGGVPLREPLPAILAPSTREPAQPKGDQPSLYLDTVRSKWDWDSILRDTRRAYAIEVLIKEIERKGEGRTTKDPEGYFYDGTYYRDDLPKWQATQDGFLNRLRTLPRPVLRSAVMRVGIDAIRPPPTRFGAGGLLFNKPDLPPGGINYLRDENSDEGKEANPYIMIDQGKWDITIIAKDILKARAVALALGDIRSQGDSTNPDMVSEFDQPVFTEDDLPVLEGFQISVEYFLGQVPLDIYGKAWDEANKFEDKGLAQRVPIDDVVINVDPRALQLVPGGGLTTGYSSPWGGLPSSDPPPPEQRGVLAGQGGGGGGSSFGLNPGQGGSLGGGEGGGVSGSPVVGGGSQGGGGSGSEGSGSGGGGSGSGSSSSSGYSPWGGSGSGGEPGGVRGRGGERSPSSGARAGGSAGGSGDSGSDPEEPRGESRSEDDTGDGSGGSGGGSGSGSSNADAELVDDVDLGGGVTYSGGAQGPTLQWSFLPQSPELDPHGRGKGGSDDVGARSRLPQQRHRITPQQRDLVGPAFRKTTGADDKERPVTGGTSGSVSTNPSESRANDVGGLHVPRTGGGGEAGSALEALLRKLGLWEKWQAGGPDPPK